MRKFLGDITFNGTVTAYDILNRSTAETQEDFTISVDPVGGTDGYILLVDQAGSTAYGSFATVESAIASLPNSIRDIVTISLADGTTNLDATFSFGDMTRFTLGSRVAFESTFADGNPGIRFTSASGLVIEPGTVQMDVSSASEETTILQSDPGFGDDAYRGAFLEVVSGTGSGLLRPIISHSGTTFIIPDKWRTDLDVTSKVEIKSPAAKLIIPEYLSRIKGNSTIGLFTDGIIEFFNIDIENATPGGFFMFFNIPMLFGDGLRIINTGVWAGLGTLWLKTCIIDGKSNVVTGIQIDGGFLRSLHSHVGWAVLDTTGAGINTSSSSAAASGAFLFNGTIDGCDIGVNANTDTYTYLETRLRGTNISYGIAVYARGVVRIVTTVGVPTEILGGVADILLDGTVEETYAEVAANEVIVGPFLSKILGGGTG